MSTAVHNNQIWTQAYYVRHFLAKEPAYHPSVGAIAINFRVLKSYGTVLVEPLANDNYPK
jgi:hypothetical protein